LREGGCLFITGRVSIMLMIVCIPCSGIHSRAGQRLTGERMIRPAGEWKSTAGTGMQAKRVRVTDAVCICVMGYQPNV
jgi:hypothetical protein